MEIIELTEDELKELEERGYVRIFREGKSVKIKINPESFRD